MYNIQIAQSGVQSSENEITLKSGLKISKGATVTIYGAYDERDKTGMPKISATVIELIKSRHYDGFYFINKTILLLY